MSWAEKQKTETPPLKILFVNDDAQAMQMNQLNIRVFKPHWNAVYADSIDKAVKAYRANPDITHIVTDKNLFGGDARTLLTKIAKLNADKQDHPNFKGAVVYSSWEDKDFDQISLDPLDAMSDRKKDNFQIEGMRTRMVRKSDQTQNGSGDPTLDAIDRHLDRLSAQGSFIGREN